MGRMANIEGKLGTLSTIGIGGSVPARFHFETIAQAQANTINFTPVYIYQDANNRPGIFVADNAYSGLLNGVDGFQDALGAKFKRFSDE